MGIHVNVAKQYTPYPLGRYKNAWPFSGEEFRERYLEPPLRNGEAVTVDLNGTRGLAPSFLEEAFGGLIDVGVPFADIDRLLTIQCDDESRVAEIWLYIKSAAGLPVD